jgi:four helix bundle protein
MGIVKSVDDVVKRFPDYEKWVLADQMRRASKSIPENIAEGYAKKRYVKSFKSALVDAMGSASEMMVHFKIALALGYVGDEECARFVEEYSIVGRQLNRLIASWRTLDSGIPTSNLQPQGAPV